LEPVHAVAALLRTSGGAGNRVHPTFNFLRELLACCDTEGEVAAGGFGDVLGEHAASVEKRTRQHARVFMAMAEW